MNKRQSDRHPRGYVPPKRQARRVIAFYVESGLAIGAREAVALDRTTLLDLGERFLQEYVRDHARRTRGTMASLPREDFFRL